jgi:hypothetical protein
MNLQVVVDINEMMRTSYYKSSHVLLIIRQNVGYSTNLIEIELKILFRFLTCPHDVQKLSDDGGEITFLFGLILWLLCFEDALKVKRK